MESALRKPLTLDRKLLKGIPLIIKNGQITLQGHDGEFSNTKYVFKKVKVLSDPLFRQDLIYDSTKHGSVTGDSRTLTIVNFFNKKSNKSKTVAKFTGINSLEERNSDQVAKLIGQKNYETVLTALCSVLDQDVKVRSILALLTPLKLSIDRGTQMEIKNKDCDVNKVVDETISDSLSKAKKIRRIKRKIGPFVVKEKKLSKKFIVYPHDILEPDNKNVEIEITTPSLSRASSFGNLSLQSGLTGYTDQMPDDEHTNILLSEVEHHTAEISLMNLGIIDIKSIGNLQQPPLLQNSAIANVKSVQSIPDLLTEEGRDSHMKVFNPTTINLYDGTKIDLPTKPEDCFHIAVPEILKNMYVTEKQKLINHQAYIDWTLCLQKDEDNNLPIHLAVINNDSDLIRRQCHMLKLRHGTVDVLGDDNLTALHICIRRDASPECTRLLLHHGADMMLCDSDDRTALHMAALSDASHLEVIVQFARENSRKILQENSELWDESFENESDEELTNILFKHISTQFDSQGHTPLTLACSYGKRRNVELLLDMCPGSIDARNANSGNTALYEAVVAACTDAEERNDLSKTGENYEVILNTLINKMADSNIENYCGNTIHGLLSEANIPALSNLIATLLSNANITNLTQDIAVVDGKRQRSNVKSDSSLTSKAKARFSKSRKIVDVAKNILLTDVSEQKPVILVNSEESPIHVANDIKVINQIDAKDYKLKRHKRRLLAGNNMAVLSKIIKTEPPV